jgi:NADH-quinone oxidoreductase subunit N
LFGMALIYAESGTMEISGVKEFFNVKPASALSLLGLTLLLVGIGFKLALVPFHFWTPDIYQGAPAPAAAFIATVSKAGVFALFMRYFAPVGSFPGHAPVLVLTVIAIASMFIGNLLGLRQNNIKRILAYSSIAHMGYFLAAFLSGPPLGVMAATYYLTAYVVTIIVAFGSLSALSMAGDAETIDDVRGLARSSPWLAIPCAIAFASLAGLPLAAGFMGKFFVLAAGTLSRSWPLAFSLIITSGIGIFYYFRVAAALFEKLPENQPSVSADRPALRGPLATSIVLWAATAAIVLFGVFPAALTALIRSIIEG